MCTSVFLRATSQRHLLTVSVAFVLACLPEARAFAWGATGHEWVSGIAIEKLPDTLPAFIRTPEAAAEIASWAGNWIARRAPARPTMPSATRATMWIWQTMVSVEGIVPLDKLPATREEYDALLRAGGKT